MDPEITDQIFDELFPVFQRLETQNAAILQLLKDKGIVGDDELAPYLEEAGKSSSVQWQVARIRVAKLLAAAEKKAEMEAAKAAIASEHTTAAEPAAKLAKRTSEARGNNRLPSEKEKDRDPKAKENRASETEQTTQDKTTHGTAGERSTESDHPARKASQQREDGTDDSSQAENQWSEAKSNKPESKTEAGPEANSSAKSELTHEPKSA